MSYLAKPAVPNLLDVAETVTDHLRASGTHCGGQNPPQKTELVCVICRYVVIHSILVPDLFVVSIFIYLTRLLHEIKCSSVWFFLSEEMQPGHEFNQYRILELLCYLNTVAGFYSDQMLRPGYVLAVFTHGKTTAVLHIMDSQEKGTGEFKQKLHT